MTLELERTSYINELSWVILYDQIIVISLCTTAVSKICLLDQFDQLRLKLQLDSCISIKLQFILYSN